MIQNYSRRSQPLTRFSKIKTRENCMISMVLKVFREEVVVEAMETSSPKCLEEVVEDSNREVHRKENLFNILLKLPSKKSIKVRPPKLL